MLTFQSQAHFSLPAWLDPKHQVATCRAGSQRRGCEAGLVFASLRKLHLRARMIVCANLTRLHACMNELFFLNPRAELGSREAAFRREAVIVVKFSPTFRHFF